MRHVLVSWGANAHSADTVLGQPNPTNLPGSSSHRRGLSDFKLDSTVESSRASGCLPPTWMDNYSAKMFPGGVPNRAFANIYSQINIFFEKMATPVDSDTDEVLLAQARAERAIGSALGEGLLALTRVPFRDAMTPDGQYAWGDDMTLYPQLEKINQEGVPVYLINGWYDIYARDNFMIYTNLSGPKRLLVRPTDHSNIEAPGSDVDLAAEAHFRSLPVDTATRVCIV